jgi:hypothetical protein
MTRREGEHEGRKDMKGGRRGRGTMDCPNKGEEIAEEQVEKNKLCLIDGHAGRKDRKGGRTRREGGHNEGGNVINCTTSIFCLWVLS